MNDMLLKDVLSTCQFKEIESLMWKEEYEANLGGLWLMNVPPNERLTYLKQPLEVKEERSKLFSDYTVEIWMNKTPREFYAFWGNHYPHVEKTLFLVA